MESSLHSLAGSEDLDLGAFLYATRRLPSSIWSARVVVMGQEAEVFASHNIGNIEDWIPLEAPARRRRWHDDGKGTLAVLLASTSDLDDLIPTLVAYQIEWNKIRSRMMGVSWEADQEFTPDRCAAVLGGAPTDWSQLFEAWGVEAAERLQSMRQHRLNLRVRMLGGSQVGYARMTRHWWAPVKKQLAFANLADRPTYFVSSNVHSLVNLLTGMSGAHEREIIDWLRDDGPDDLREELESLRERPTDGSWENFLYYSAHRHSQTSPKARRTPAGIEEIESQTALHVATQVITLSDLDPSGLDPRLGDVDQRLLASCPAVIVNIEYPLGLAAYNILREITEASDTLRGVYVLGKAATLNADVGDVLISNVIHDEHSGSTYWLDNAFSFEDISPYLLFGSGLDNQRAVTVKSTFLQNKKYLDFYYREAYTVVEMETGPYCNAVYELSDLERYPVGEAVNFSKLPIDFGVIHYASDTPYTQARTLGAPGLSYFGMDSTYASSLAILRRILKVEGVLGLGSEASLRETRIPFANPPG
jgi:hypothetical protein